MTSPDAARRATERWFLDRGLPAVVTQRARLRAVWPRSAPGLAGLAAVGLGVLAIYLLLGQTKIDIDGPPTPVEWVVLSIIVAALPLAGLIGWLVSRMTGDRAPAIASGAAAAVTVAAPGIAADVHGVIFAALLVALVLVITASGLGSVLGWAARLTSSHLAAAGSLLIRALPVLLLTVLVFFNSPVWLMASIISRRRLWLALLFLGAIAAAFLISGTLDRARPIMNSAVASTGDAAPGHSSQLAETPFEAMPDPPIADPLSRTERLNVLFVLVASQLVQVLMVTAVTAALFFVLGLILLSPELLAAWTRNGSSDGTVLGMTIPVPQALIQITLFLGALTFMYISARAVGDAEYRAQFLDPLIDDLKLTLLARNRYRNSAPARRPRAA
jgi:hypothetical protein